MLILPRDLLERLASLPPGTPCRVVLHTNGYGEWKTETTIFEGACRGDPVIIPPAVSPAVSPEVPPD